MTTEQKWYQKPDRQLHEEMYTFHDTYIHPFLEQLSLFSWQVV